MSWSVLYSTNKHELTSENIWSAFVTLLLWRLRFICDDFDFHSSVKSMFLMFGSQIGLSWTNSSHTSKYLLWDVWLSCCCDFLFKLHPGGENTLGLFTFTHSVHVTASEPSGRSPAARLPCCCCVPWFEFQNISDWLRVLTADDLMETLLSGALKNWRMIYNELQPLVFFFFSWWDVRFGFCAGLGALCSFITRSSPFHPAMSSRRVSFYAGEKACRHVGP